MFELVIFLHTCMVILVTSNPLQGFQSCPVIQYQQNYRNVQQPIILQPNDYMFYQQQPSVQNQLPVQSTPYTNEDYSKRLYFITNLSNQRVPLTIDSNAGAYDQNTVGNLWYGLQPPLSSPRVTNFIGESQDIDSSKNENIPQINEPCSDKKRVYKNTVSLNNINDSVSTKKREKKICKDDQMTKKSDHSKSRPDHQDDDIERAKKSSKHVRKSSKKSRKSKKTQKLARKDESENTSRDELDKSITKERNELPKEKKLRKSKKIRNGQLQTDDIIAEIEDPKTKKRSNIVKNKAESQANTEDTTHHNNQILEKNNCFNINEDCTELENRNIRNYNSHTNKNRHQQLPYIPFDYSINNIASYINHMMSNPQLYTNMFYNFDNLYQLPQFQSTPMSQKERQKTNKGTGKRRRKKKKSDKSTSNRNNDRPIENNSKDCNKINELSPTFIEVDKNNEPITFNVVTNTEENNEKLSVDKSVQNSFKIIPEIVESHLDDEIDTHKIDKLGYEDDIPFISNNGLMDEYYPDFTADSFYNSKENHDWDSFHDRYYYNSDDSNIDGQRHERVNINSGHEGDYSTDNNNRDQVVQDVADDIKKGVTIQNDRTFSTSHEPIKFRTPPKLEYPDFKTEKLNKEENDIRPEVYYCPSNLDGKENVKKENSKEDEQFEIHRFNTDIVNRDLYNPIHEMYYEPSNKIVKEYEGNKISTFSNIKTPTSVTNANNIANQNNVETIFAQSKVVRYSPTQEQELTIESTDDSIENEREEKNLISHDGDIFVVLAKSIENDLYK